MKTAHDHSLPPALSPHLFGHGDAEATLLHAIKTQHLHHAWLFYGPKGIGKAVLAYRLARYMLAYGHDEEARASHTTLEVCSDHQVFRQVAAASHQDFHRITIHGTAKKRPEIAVDDIRRAIRFFSLTTSRNTWRVTVIDGADCFNMNAANALLKVLEEPPPRSLFILTANALSRLPATVRSRCRKLSLSPLPRPDFDRACQQGATGTNTNLASLDLASLYKLSEGRPGRALFFAMSGEWWQDIAARLRELPAWDSDKMHTIAEQASGKNGQEFFIALQDSLCTWIREKIADINDDASHRDTVRTYLGVWDRLISLTSEGHPDHAQMPLTLLGVARTAALACQNHRLPSGKTSHK